MCDYQAEMTQKAAAATVVAATHPLLIATVALIVVLTAIVTKSHKKLAHLGWLAFCLWLGPTLAAKPTVITFYKMLGSGDCIGMPWLTMFPAMALALIVGGGITLATWAIGVIPLSLAPKRTRPRKAKPEPPPFPPLKENRIFREWLAKRSRER